MYYYFINTDEGVPDMRTSTYAATALIAAAALALTGCSDPNQAGKTSTASASASAATFDMSTIQAVPEIAAMVPDKIKTAGKLINGASVDYSPAEFFKEDGKTPTGYDVDITNAVAKVMGLSGADTTHAEFASIIPALGSKFDISASAFTITEEREKEVNMVSYIEAGTAYAVAKGNPKNFSPDKVCGTTIGVQNGTYQFDYITAESEKCVAKGEKAITIMPHDLQTDIATKVIGQQYDATLADSPVIGYTVSLSKGQLEQVGATFESAPQGILVAKNDEQIAKAVQAAVQHLMDKGYLKQILATYGAEQAALSTAQLNPAL